MSELLPHMSRIAMISARSARCTPNSMTTKAPCGFFRRVRVRWPPDARQLGHLRTWHAKPQSARATWCWLDPKGFQVDGIKNWSAGWLPALYQGTPLRSDGSPSVRLEIPPNGACLWERGSATRDCSRPSNERHRRDLPHLTELEARIANFELGANIPRRCDRRDGCLAGVAFGRSSFTEPISRRQRPTARGV